MASHVAVRGLVLSLENLQQISVLISNAAELSTNVYKLTTLTSHVHIHYSSKFWTHTI